MGDGAGYRIDHIELMEPFLTTVVSAADLWMFISSTGALTAGRIDADHALFPYLTDDRLHRSVGTAGPHTVIARQRGQQRSVWRPFAAGCPPYCSRSITKGTMSEVLVLEEHHHEWDLTFRTLWSPSPAYGWVRTSVLVNRGSDGEQLEVLDGLVDLMPAGVDAVAEQTRSNLVDAYKRSEVGPWGTAAIYTLESLITDRAEPGEALAATLVWSNGLASMRPLLDERAADDVAAGTEPRQTSLLTGRPGAYLLHGTVELPASADEAWTIVADTGLDHAALVNRLRDVHEPGITARLSQDVAAGRDRLRSLLEGVDAFQHSA